MSAREPATRESAGIGGGSRSSRRAQLLHIAAELFARRGYAQTSVRDIAEEAGILSGSLYHHFASKEAMIDEILRHFLSSLCKRFEEIENAGGDTRETLDALVNHVFATIHSQPTAVALYQNESVSIGNQPGFEYVREMGQKIEKIWLRVLRNGQHDGTLRRDFDIDIAYRFLRDAMWASVHWYRPRGKYRPTGIATQFLQLIDSGLGGTVQQQG